jgi:hypothetical protein
MNVPDWDKLIPKLKDWNNGAGIDPKGWVGCEGNFQLAVAYTTIFWPRFVEYDDMVLREDFDLKALKGFMQQEEGNKSSVEAVMNHLHFVDIQYVGCPDATHDHLIYLGRVLKEIYECKLHAQFPERDIVVAFDESQKEDIFDYEMTFFQNRHG